MLRNINVFDNLSANSIDSDDFLAGVTFAVFSLQCVGTVRRSGHVGCGRYPAEKKTLRKSIFRR